MKEESNLIRRKNRDKLMAFLFSNGKAFKAEMAKETGISVVTINSLVKELVRESILIEGPLIQQGMGRPAHEYHFNYDKAFYLLLSIQEKNSLEMKRELEIVVKIVNLEGTVKVSEAIGFPQINIKTLLEVVEHYLNRDYEIERIGIALPGKVFNGVVTSSWENEFDGWYIERELKKITDVPIKVQNDAHLMTMGYCAHNNLLKSETVVGIFYPEKSMPGITIFSNGAIIEGQKGLAGEAKYLPILMDRPAPETGTELSGNLSEIMAIYNAVIAPSNFIISSERVDAKIMSKAIDSNQLLPRQPNKPVISFNQDFEGSITRGLIWLVTEGTIYEISKEAHPKI